MAGQLEYSSTAASNTTLNGIGIAGSNSVKNGDDALRQLMADTASAITKVVDKTGTYTALKTDFNQMIRATGTLTLSLTAAATLTAGWCIWVKADGGAVTIDPNSTEQINGASTLVVANGSSALIICTGSAFRAIVAAGMTEIQAALSVAPFVPLNNGSAVTVDFDTITTPGWHSRVLTTDTGMHGPGANSTFYYVQVIESAGGNLIQEAYPYRATTEKKYIRTRFSGTWTAWKQYAYADEALALSGGTMTGKITLDGDPSSALHAATKQYVDAIDIPATLAGLSVGAVGTWAYLIPATGGAATYNPGTTLAGSSLNYSGSQFSGGTTRGTSPSGTWRCMGQSARNSTDANCYSTAWLRIS